MVTKFASQDRALARYDLDETRKPEFAEEKRGTGLRFTENQLTNNGSDRKRESRPDCPRSAGANREP